MTLKELESKVRNGELKYHHTAKALGYVSRRTKKRRIQNRIIYREIWKRI